jgi:hypothetical protein
MNLLSRLKRRFGRTVLIEVHPPADRRLNAHGRCSVCGRETPFVFNSWVIPEELQAEWNDPLVSLAYKQRESLFCRACGASMRVRRVADVLISLYSPSAGSVSELIHDESFRRLRIAEINMIGSVGSLHSLLAELPSLSFSEYQGPTRLGETLDGVRNEDMCRLTYEDGSFDLVLSSDTLEHVPDFDAALRESRRVLRPGGRHIFTVPIVASRSTTTTRAEIADDGTVVHRTEPLYHGRGAGLYRYIPAGSDLLTFTEFGLDLTEYMRAAGFEPEISRGANGQDETGAAWVFSGLVPE